MRLGQVLSTSAVEALDSLEIFVLITTALLHDIGLVDPDAMPNDPVIRDTHHIRSARFAEKFLREQMPNCSDRLLAIIGFVIECHGLDWDEMTRRKQFQTRETIGSSSVRSGVIATLLRVGDLLDLDSDRVNRSTMTMFHELLQQNNSLPHHDRHLRVVHFFCSQAKIEVEVDCESIVEYRIWKQWLKHLQSEIERGNTHVFREDLTVFQLPKPIIDVRPAANSRFELWDLRFEIDDDGMLWNVLRKSLYTGQFDFVREIISNGLDACMVRTFRIVGRSLLEKRPRTWDCKTYRPRVVAFVDQEHRRVAVCDNGIGMAKEQLRSFLFRVASRGKAVDPEDRAAMIPTIGNFGIGFISTLTRASSVTILTRPFTNDEQGYSVSLDANLRDATVERINGNPIGTSIVLELREDKLNGSISDYIVKTFSLPISQISVVDIGRLRDVQEYLSSEQVDFPNSVLSWIDQILEGEDPMDLADQALELEKRMQSSVKLENEVRKKFNETRSILDRKQLIGDLVRPFIRKIAPKAPPPLRFDPTLINLNGNGEIVGAYPVHGKESKPLTDFSVVVVPLSIDDDELGIEWRSAHAFLVADHMVARSFMFSVDVSGQRLTDSILSTDDFESRDDVYEAFERTLEDDWLGIGDFLNGQMCSVHRLAEMGVSYDEVNTSIDDIVFSIRGMPNISVFAPFDDVAYKLKRKQQERIARVFKWFGHSRRDVVCQDGIQLPIQIASLAPIGAVSGVVNFTGASRFDLNVSRNAIDESPTSLKRWRDEVGYTVLSQLSVKLREAFSSCKVDFDWRSVWLNSGCDIQIMSLKDWRESFEPERSL